VISKLGKQITRKNPKDKFRNKRVNKDQRIQGLLEKSHPIQWTEFPTGALVGAGSCWPRVQTLTRAVVCGRKSVEVICGSSSVGNAHGI
jgi:hypothetical protein